MDIQGPVKVGVVEPSADGNYELHIDFTEDFKAMGLAGQGEAMRDYLDVLATALDEPEQTLRDRQGMLLMQQICEQLAEPVRIGDLALNETLVVEVQRTPGVNLADLLN